jgi:hypothetical protein
VFIGGSKRPTDTAIVGSQDAEFKAGVAARLLDSSKTGLATDEHR